MAFDDAEIIAAAAVACRVIARYVNDSAGGQQINITVGRQHHHFFDRWRSQSP